MTQTKSSGGAKTLQGCPKPRLLFVSLGYGSTLVFYAWTLACLVPAFDKERKPPETRKSTTLARFCSFTGLTQSCWSPCIVLQTSGVFVHLVLRPSITCPLRDRDSNCVRWRSWLLRGSKALCLHLLDVSPVSRLCFTCSFCLPVGAAWWSGCKTLYQSFDRH